MSQEQFGKTIGLQKSAISKIELGQSNLTEMHIIVLSREFNVSEEWLRNGTGEMFKIDKDDIDFLLAKYGAGLTENQSIIIKAILSMSAEEKEALGKFIDRLKSMR